MKNADRATIFIIVGVAALHLMALYPIALANNETMHEDAIDVVIELAPNQPATSGTRAERTPTLTRPRTHTSRDGQEASSPTEPSVAETNTLPTTHASYEVGSTQNPRPPYPPAAFFARIEGRVIVKVHVMRDGKPAEVQLLQTSGSALLDKSALDTISRWELQPARQNGQAIEQWIEIPIHFRVLQK